MTPTQCAGKCITYTPVWPLAIFRYATPGGCPVLCSGEHLRTSMHRLIYHNRATETRVTSVYIIAPANIFTPLRFRIVIYVIPQCHCLCLAETGPKNSRNVKQRRGLLRTIQKIITLVVVNSFHCALLLLYTPSKTVTFIHCCGRLNTYTWNEWRTYRENNIGPRPTWRSWTEPHSNETDTTVRRSTPGVPTCPILTLK